MWPTVTYSSVELFTIPEWTWTIISQLTTARAGQTANLLPNGKLLVRWGGGVICSYAGQALIVPLFPARSFYDVPGGFLDGDRFDGHPTLISNGEPADKWAGVGHGGLIPPPQSCMIRPAGHGRRPVR